MSVPAGPQRPPAARAEQGAATDEPPPAAPVTAHRNEPPAPWPAETGPPRESPYEAGPIRPQPSAITSTARGERAPNRPAAPQAADDEGDKSPAPVPRRAARPASNTAGDDTNPDTGRAKGAGGQPPAAPVESRLGGPAASSARKPLAAPAPSALAPSARNETAKPKWNGRNEILETNRGI